jgi:HEAT repeat protein
MRWRVKTNQDFAMDRSVFIFVMALVALAFTMTPHAKGGAALARPQATIAPHVQNAKFETIALSAPLEESFRSLVDRADKPEWIGYSVPEIPGDRSMCCGNFRGGDAQACATCELEREHGATITSTSKDASAASSQTNRTVNLEGSRQLLVLLRVEAKQVVRIRMASEDCTLDAGGLPLLWLTGVKPGESVALLQSYVHDTNFAEHGGRGVGEGALTAIAFTGDPSADRAMQSFIAADQPEPLRKQTAFWLGAARGKSGLSLLQQMANSDPSPDVRSHVAFALSVSHEFAALDAMIRMARDDSSAHVRGQALFWLAQKAGNKAVGAITGAIENDPDTEVKKKAVFALSQLPKDQGVPKLIEVAQTNKNPAVRKQAMFWLGQSNDPRALDFFEKVLTR